MELRKYRELRKLSIAEAAYALEVTKPAYWRWENKKGMPSQKSLQRIAEWSDGAVMPNDFVIL